MAPQIALRDIHQATAPSWWPLAPGWWIVIAVVVAILVLQLIPYGRNHNNPPVVAEPAWDSPATRTAFMQACGDCHSNETTWPWYSQVAPMSWLIQHDVDEGRT